MRKVILIAGLLAMTAAAPIPAADWPQFMHDAAHTGDASDEQLKLPLGLLAQVKLDDAVLSSPAVVGGRAYVVDQMGTAYCVDPGAGKVLWKTSPDAENAVGLNTSSPCVVKGRLYYGTTAGTFHILSAADGKLIRTLKLGAPIVSSPTYANDSIYLHSVDAVVRCLDLTGNERWRWDHYKQYDVPLPDRLKRYHPGSYDRPHYGGGEVAVSGKRVVTSVGWDHLCLEDQGTAARLVWCNRAALGKDDGIPMAASIAAGYVHVAWPGVDGAGSLLRVALKDGSFDRKKDQLHNLWAILGTPAVRGATVYFGRHVKGVTAHQVGKGTQWRSASSSDPDGTPVISSPVLSRDHCLFTTVFGELIAVNLSSRGADMERFRPKPFRFRTPHGKMIGSTPAVSGGRVFFGADDGYLYVLAPGGGLKPTRGDLSLHTPSSTVVPATGKSYAWPSPNGDLGNTRFVDDPGLRPPFRLRWAVRSFGLFHQPISATQRDLVYVTMAGTVVCLEQRTARLRWRLRLPRQSSDLHGLLAANGRLYVARPQRKNGALYCLDQATGKTLWKVAIGANGVGLSKTPPLLADGLVAFASVRGDPPAPVAEAWDAKTGRPAWQVRIKVRGRTPKQTPRAPAGCVLDGVFFFSAGGKTDDRPKDRYPGETIAVQAKTGKVLWRTGEAFTTTYSAVMARRGRVYVFAYAGPMTCLSAKDGTVIWRSKRQFNYIQHGPTLGGDYFAVKGYGGSARRYNLADGKAQPGQLGGAEHTCSSVVLTSSGLSLVATVGGLYARDPATGKLLWLSPMGFAPRNCTNPAVTNGRIYINPQVNGMLYCFEPIAAQRSGRPQSKRSKTLGRGAK